MLAAILGTEALASLTSLADRLGCTIDEAERHLLDGTAADELRRTEPEYEHRLQTTQRRGIEGRLALDLILRR